MTDWLPQYRALHESAGHAVWPVARLVLTGRDRVRLLHNLCTNELRKLAPGDAIEAMLTTVKGHVLALAQIGATDESLVVHAASAVAADLVTHIDRYIIRDDVQVTDSASEMATVLVAGPRSRELCAAVTTGIANALHWPVAAVDAPAALLDVPAERLDTLLAELVRGGSVPCEDVAVAAWRVEQGWPLTGRDFAPGTLPQELARDQRAISFTKGCYLGQEVVARIDALGHVNRLLAQVAWAVDAMPADGCELLAAGKAVGVASSVVHSPRLSRPLAFALLRRGSHTPGTRLESAAGPCEVVTTA